MNIWSPLYLSSCFWVAGAPLNQVYTRGVGILLKGETRWAVVTIKVLTMSKYFF